MAVDAGGLLRNVDGMRGVGSYRSRRPPHAAAGSASKCPAAFAAASMPPYLEASAIPLGRSGTVQVLGGLEGSP